MPKNKPLLFLILIFIAGLSIFLIIERPATIPEEEGLIEEEPTLEKFIPSERARAWKIGGGDLPARFAKELIIDPFIVKEGEKQIFSVWVIDPQGIEKVIGNIKTDTGQETIEFKLVEGAEQEGRWQGSWAAKDISLQSIYRTVIRATNMDGEDNTISPPWKTEAK